MGVMGRFSGCRARILIILRLWVGQDPSQNFSFPVCKVREVNKTAWSPQS